MRIFASAPFNSSDRNEEPLAEILVRSPDARAEEGTETWSETSRKNTNETKDEEKRYDESGIFYGCFNASWLKNSKHKSTSLLVSSPVSVLAYFKTAVRKGERKVKTLTWWLSNVLQRKMDGKEDASVTADQWLEILHSRLFWLSRRGLCFSLNSSVIFIDMKPPTLTVDSPGVTTSLLTLTPSRQSPTCDLPGDQPVENHLNSACSRYSLARYNAFILAYVSTSSKKEERAAEDTEATVASPMDSSSQVGSSSSHRVRRSKDTRYLPSFQTNRTQRVRKNSGNLLRVKEFGASRHWQIPLLLPLTQ